MVDSKIVEMLKKRNHRVFIRVKEIPSIGKVISQYVDPTGLTVITVSKSRFGIVYILANGANITFGVNDIGKPKYYQLIIDDTEVKKNELERDT